MPGIRLAPHDINHNDATYLKLTRGKDGKVLTEAQKHDLFIASLKGTPEGQIYDFIVKNWKYGLYGAGAYMLLQFTGHVINVYKWWKGSSNARERASLEKSLNKLTAALGSKDNLLDVAIKIDKRRKRSSSISRRSRSSSSRWS